MPGNNRSCRKIVPDTCAHAFTLPMMLCTICLAIEVRPMEGHYIHHRNKEALWESCLQGCRLCSLVWTCLYTKRYWHVFSDGTKTKHDDLKLDAETVLLSADRHAWYVEKMNVSVLLRCDFLPGEQGKSTLCRGD